MAFETGIAYLVALSLPVWLVAEQVKFWRRSLKRPEGQVESGSLPRVSASGSSAPASRSRLVPAFPRKPA